MATVGAMSLALALGGVGLACSDDDGDDQPEIEAPDDDINEQDEGDDDGDDQP